MAKVITGEFGRQAKNVDWAKYRSQEHEPGGKPDLDVPPDVDVPNFDKPNSDLIEPPGSPPFTGEDVEDIPRQEPRRDHPVM